VNIQGNIINNGYIQNFVNYLTVNVDGNIQNNGAWTNAYTYLNGITEQHIHLQDGHYITGQMRFVSDIQVAPYQWIWNGWAIQNPPYPQPAIFSGETSGTLIFLNPVDNARTGTYYCSTGGSPSRNIIVDEISSLRLDVTAFLEGPYDGSEMGTTLKSEGSIPTQQPYGTAPWNYDGSEWVITIPDNVVDWVLVELRDATSAVNATSATIIERQAAFILNDGSIVNKDGVSNVFMKNPVVQNSLFVVIAHRNHLSVMSANALSFMDGVYSCDFTTSANQAYGNNMTDLGGGVFGLYGGDGNADGTINEFDGIEAWYPTVGQTGYLPGDANLDGQVNNPDKNDIWFPNYGLSEQLPPE
jgi:hypothetical protein